LAKRFSQKFLINELVSKRGKNTWHRA